MRRLTTDSSSLKPFRTTVNTGGYSRSDNLFCYLFVFLFLLSSPLAAGSEWETLIRQADSLSRLQEFGTAVQNAKAALDIVIEEQGPTDSVAASILNRLGDYSYDRADFGAAGPYYTRALEIRLKLFGESHVQVASSLDRLATLLSYLEQLDSATVLYEKALDVFERELGSDHPRLGVVLNNMAMIMSKRGAYAKASMRYLRAISLEESTDKPNLYRLTAYRNNLAVVYLNQNDYERAVANYEEIVRVQEELSGIESAALIPYLSNLGIAYKRQAEQAKAELIFRRAYNLCRQKMGAMHTETANCAHNLAGCLKDIQKYDEAAELYDEALMIRERILGPDHPLTSSTAIEQSSMYMSEGKLAEAGKILEGRMRFDTVHSPDSTPIGAENLLYYWRYLRLTNRRRKAFQIANIAFESVVNHFQANSWVLPEEDALKFANLSRRAAHKGLTSFMDIMSPSPADLITAGAVILKVKGQVSDEIFERHMRLATESDSGITELVNDYTERRRHLSQLYIRGNGGKDGAEYQALLDSLTEEVTRLESKLARKSTSFKLRQDSRNVSVAGVRALIPSDAVLIEYLKYSYEAPDSDELQFRYLAAVFDDDSLMSITDLGAIDLIDSLVITYREHMLRLAGATHSPLTRDNQEYAIIAEQVYEAVLAPLQEYFSGRNLLLIAPDGVLEIEVTDISCPICVQEFRVIYRDSC